MLRRKIFTMAIAAAMTILMSMTALAGAGNWQKNDTGWWWQESDGGYPTNEWVWIDGDLNGTAECYYFDGNGYLLVNTTTPDGNQVNADGAWIQNGQIQTQVQGKAQAGALSTKEIYAVLEARKNGVTTLIIDHSKPENVNGVTNIRAESDKYYDGWKWQIYKSNYGLSRYCAIAINSDGYVLVNTTTPDGYYVDQYGILTIDGKRVYHAKNCSVFPFWYDLIDMNGNVVPDKNNCDLSKINVIGLKNIIGDSVGQHIPWGKLVYNHCFYSPVDGSAPTEGQGFGDICVKPEDRPDVQ